MSPDYSGDFLIGSTTTYDYDSSGRLIREFRTENYTVNAGKTLEFTYLYDESGIIGVMYSYNGATAQPYYYRRNPQGDVVAIYDANGNQKAGYAYDALVYNYNEIGNITNVKTYAYTTAATPSGPYTEKALAMIARKRIDSPDTDTTVYPTILLAIPRPMEIKHLFGQRVKY